LKRTFQKTVAPKKHGYNKKDEKGVIGRLLEKKVCKGKKKGSKKRRRRLKEKGGTG